MPAPLVKLIPTAVMIAVLAYLGSPYIGAEVVANRAVGKLPEIANELLRPVAPEPTERDPFGNSVRFELGETSSQRPGYRTPANKAGTAKPGDASAAAATSKQGGAPADLVPPADLVLNATLLRGPSKVAMINGRAYRPGDCLEDSKLGAAYSIADVQHHQVVLEYEGKRVNLLYSDEAAAPKPALAAQAKGPNKPKTARPATTAKPTTTTRPRVKTAAGTPNTSSNTQSTR